MVQTIDRVIVWWGRSLLIVDTIWTIAWFATGMVELARESPLPPVLVTGLPLWVYDTVGEYSVAHLGIALHFLLSGSMFLLAAANGEEIITAWYMLPLGAVVAKDTYAVLERFLHLSREAHYDLFIIEATLAVTALFITVMAFGWFQAVYWRLRLTGKRFDAGEKAEPATLKKTDDRIGGSVHGYARLALGSAG